MGKRDREQEVEKYGRELSRGERGYLVADKVDKKLAGLIGRCSIFCGDVECKSGCLNP